MAGEIGIGIIGAGFMGMLHARALAQLTGVKIVAASDPLLKEPPKLPSGEVRLYAGHQDLLARKDVDAVVIASPETLHRQVVEDAAKAGKHILLEKPIATTLADADAIIAAAERHGQADAGHILRYDVRYAQIKAAVEQGSSAGPWSATPGALPSRKPPPEGPGGGGGVHLGARHRPGALVFPGPPGEGQRRDRLGSGHAGAGRARLHLDHHPFRAAGAACRGGKPAGPVRSPSAAGSGPPRWGGFVGRLPGADRGEGRLL
jgi:hypothetical protein